MSPNLLIFKNNYVHFIIPLQMQCYALLFHFFCMLHGRHLYVTSWSRNFV